MPPSLFKKTYGKSRQQAAAAAVARARATILSSRRAAYGSSRRYLGARGPELKFLETSGTVLVSGQATATVFPISTGILLGTDISGRIGRKIVVKSIYCRFATGSVSTTVGSSPVRIMIVYDKQANAAQCTAAQLLTSDAITGMNLLDNRDRFTVLCDQVIQSVSTTDAAHWTKYIKCNLEIIYNSTNGGTIADIVTGTLTVFVWQNGAITGTAPTNTFRARIRYLDA